MKILDKEFTGNFDKSGEQRFKQVKRNELAALYRRETLDGKFICYEVFQIKTAGGTEIFGRYYEEYEQYPGSASFGKTAWNVLSLDRAEQIFAEIVKGDGSRKSGQDLDKPVAVVKVRRTDGKRGRLPTVRPAIVFPKRKWCMKDLAKANENSWTQPTLYIEVQKLLKAKKVVEAERKSFGRGKPTVFYKVL